MKRYIAGITILLLLGTFSWGQGTKGPFDVKKSGEEMEIMKGILNTTLRFAAQNSQTQSPRLRFSNTDSFYLVGQGVVFMLSTSAGLRGSFNLGPEFAENIARLDELRASLLAQTRSKVIIRENRGQNTILALPAPPAPPAPPTPPIAPAPPSASAPKQTNPMQEVEREKLRKAVEGELAKVNKSREEAEANREKLLKALADAKVCLIEAIANYGDSMTTVKPEEYVNLVLITDERSDVISVRRSWITDYKAGKLNLEGFKQKVIQYTQ
jgi:hypothetical protein